ncbi:type II secretion system protein N [uncultured Tateyamaria sp.]|uniref:type II secretion system protein N n=1 Tax=uncultured Tateyamaria sp. TaxID=455651 RepID=UPI00262A4839|nr:type II secretion system protein N [uncultured Tateyamaria sp.]
MTRGETVIRCALAAGAMASVLWAAVPAARHMAGVVVLSAPHPVARADRPAENALDLADILELAPFGRLPVLDSAPEVGSADQPDIALRGIFAANDATSAALLDVGGVPGLYREMMEVSDRVTVSLITPHVVKLTDGAKTITLTFDGDTEVVAPTERAGSDAPASLLDRLRGGFVVPATYERPSKPETTAQYIDYWRTRVRKNPQAVLDEIGLKPTDKGYVIADTHDIGVQLAGLRSGDLVRSVNGQAVGDPEADRKFYDEIAAAGEARIEVERGGRVLSFSFPLR